MLLGSLDDTPFSENDLIFDLINYTSKTNGTNIHNHSALSHSMGGGVEMAKQKANHVIPGMNAAKAQGNGAGFHDELGNEPPLSEEQRQNNKKRKKNQ